MKQSLIRFLLLALFLAVKSGSFAYYAIVDGIGYYINQDTASVAYRDDPYKGVIIIPSEIVYEGNTYRVTSINNDAFSSCRGLKSISIPNSVTTIGNNAFSGCSGLTSITIPNSVTLIGERAFQDCIRLTSITLSNSVTSIGREVFSNCSGLTSITIPNSVTSIGKEAFYRCSSLLSVTINNGVTLIDERAFQECSGLTSITIPNSVTSIGMNAFARCYFQNVRVLANEPPRLYSTIDTKSLEVPIGCTLKYVKADYWKDVEKIFAINGATNYYPVFFYEEGQKVVNLEIDSGEGKELAENSPMQISLISGYPKNSLIMAGGVDVSDSIKTKGNLSFTASPYHQLNHIETYAFSTKEVTLPTSGMLLDQIGIDNIDNIYSLKISGDINGTDILVIRKMNNLKMLDLKDATIVNGGASYYQNYVTSENSIGDYFFFGKENLLRVILPRNIESIGECAFGGCEKLKTILFPSSLKSVSNPFWGYYSLESVTILAPKEIGAWFGGKNSIKSVIIGDNVTSIGWRAFSGCDGLKSINIPNSVTSIDTEAFEYCNGLKSVSFGKNIKIIGEHAFYGCSSLENVYIQDIASWCNISFHPYGLGNGNPLCYAHNLILNDNVIKDLIIPNGVTSISDWAFTRFCGLTSVNIPNSVTSIGTGVFKDCSGLKSVVIGNGVTSIGEYAFQNCNDLTSMTIGTSVSSISRYAFASCNSLTSIVIPNSVTSISSNVFQNCSNMTSVTIGSGVTSIDWAAFSGCSSLTSVISLNTTPPKLHLNLSWGSFDKTTYDNATLYVPKGCKTVYWLNPGWENFKNIVELGDTGIDDVTVDQHQQREGVYTIDGVKLSANVDNNENLPKGIYIINGQKVVIK